MKRVVLTMVAVAACAGLLFAGGGKLEWEQDYEKGLAKVKETGKPAFLLFTADW